MKTNFKNKVMALLTIATMVFSIFQFSVINVMAAAVTSPVLYDVHVTNGVYNSSYVPLKVRDSAGSTTTSFNNVYAYYTYLTASDAGYGTDWNANTEANTGVADGATVTTNNGTTYKWQSSPDNTTFTDISGKTGVTVASKCMGNTAGTTTTVNSTRLVLADTYANKYIRCIITPKDSAGNVGAAVTTPSVLVKEDNATMLTNAILPSADAYVDGSNTTYHYGGAAALNFSNSNGRYPFYKFNIASFSLPNNSLAAGEAVKSAVVRSYYVGNLALSGGAISAYDISNIYNTWTENTTLNGAVGNGTTDLTFNLAVTAGVLKSDKSINTTTLPTAATTTAYTIPYKGTASNNFYDVDVKPIVTANTSRSDNTITFMLSNSTGISFQSKERGYNSTKTYNLPILILNKLTGISVATNPTKTTYNKNESINLTGMTVQGTYTDGTTATVTVPNDANHISGFDSSTTGTRNATVSYGGQTATVSYTVQDTPAAPVASNVNISGYTGYTSYAKVGNVLTPSYTYFDSNDEVEAGSTYRWLSSTSSTDFTSATVLDSGTTTAGTASSATYTVKDSDLNNYIAFEITPKNNASQYPVGSAAQSSSVQALIARYIVNDSFEGLGLSSGAQPTNTPVSGWNVTSGKSISVGTDSTTYLCVPTDTTITSIQKTLSSPLNTTNPASLPVTMDFRVKTPPANANAYNLVLYASNPADRIFQLSVRSDTMWVLNTFVAQASPYSTKILDTSIQSIKPNTWYNVRLVVSFDSKTVMCYVGNTATSLVNPFNNGNPMSFYSLGLSPNFYMADNFQKISFETATSLAGFDDVKLFYGNVAPVASGLSVTGTGTLNASYAYYDADSDIESGSIYKWETSLNGTTNWATVATGTTTATLGATHIRGVSDLNKYLRFSITPYNAMGIGSTVTSSVFAPIYQVSIVNAADNSPATLSLGGTIKGMISLKNEGASSQSYILLCGLYNGTKLIGVAKSDSFTLAPGESVAKNTNGSFTVSANSGYKIKALLWQDMTTIKPLLSATTFN